MLTFGLVVEGNDDKTALTELIQKCARTGVDVVSRTCGGKAQLMKMFPAFLTDFRHIKSGANVDKALVMRDADQKDPVELIKNMHGKINNRNYVFPVKLLVIVQELEAWLLADETAVSLVTGKTTPAIPNPEGLSDPKQRLRNVLSKAKISYTAEIARKIAARAKIEILESRCPSFREFREAVIDC